MSEALREHKTSQVLAVERPQCQSTRKDGKPCTSTLVGSDGYCVQHSPTRRFDPVEAGRKGGQKSALARRASSKNGEAPTREGREKLRHDFENDAEFYAKVKAAYENGLEAVTTCPSCKERALPDHRARLLAGDSVLAQIYGKPKQNVESKHEHTLVVVSRTRAALEDVGAASADRLNGQVIEYDELTAGD